MSTRRRILDAALKCFSEHGTEKTSIEQIRALSGASVGSIYHHFGDKDGIALALYIEGLREANAAALHRLAKARDGRDGVQALITAFSDWVADNERWARYVYGTAALWQSSSELKTVNEEFFTRVGKWFEARIAQGEIRALPLMVLFAIVYGPVFTYARRWLQGQADRPLKPVTRTFVDAAWRAIAA